MTLHPYTMATLAGQHEADLAREAHNSRLARLAAGGPEARGAIRHRLAPAVAAALVVVLGLFGLFVA